MSNDPFVSLFVVFCFFMMAAFLVMLGWHHGKKKGSRQGWGAAQREREREERR